jgi:hypothetical protein
LPGDTSSRFILLWNDENDLDRNARRVADNLDEEKASEEF